MATEVQLGSKMVHHMPQSAKLALHVVSEEGAVTRLLMFFEDFHALVFLMALN